MIDGLGFPIVSPLSLLELFFFLFFRSFPYRVYEFSKE